MKKLYMPGQSFVDSLGHIGYPIQVHHTVFSAKACCRCKGQLISECPFDVLDFPKNQRKNLTNFCPRI